MFENLKEPENILEAKLQSRLDFLNSDFENYQNFKSSILNEDISLSKKRREELFLNKRKLWNPILKSTEAISIPNLSNSSVHHENLQNVNSNPFQTIPVLKKEDLDQIKFYLSEGLQNEEKYEKLLDYIIHMASNENNNKYLVKSECLYLISNNLSKMNSEIKNIQIKSIIAISSLIKSDAKFYMIKQGISKSCLFLKTHYDVLEDYLKNIILWLISFTTSEFTKKAVNILLKEDMISFIFGLLKENEEVLTNALRILGNVCECNDKKTQKVIDEGFLKELNRLLSHNSTKIRIDAVWIISNIAVGSQSQIEGLIEENIYNKLKDLVVRDCYVVRKEAVWAICNLSNIRNPYYAENLLDQGYLENLIQFLHHSNPKFNAIALEAISNLLELENTFYNCPDNYQISYCLNIKKKLITNGFLDILENLQYHHNNIVCERAKDLFDSYILSDNVY